MADDQNSHKPPKGVVSNAKKALEAIKDGKAGGGFTSVGRARAKQLASGQNVSTAVVRKMHSYFSRHEKGDQGKQKESGTPAHTAWLAWGGDAGKNWARGVVNKLDGSKSSSQGDPMTEMVVDSRGNDVDAGSLVLTDYGTLCCVESVIASGDTGSIRFVDLDGRDGTIIASRILLCED